VIAARSAFGRWTVVQRAPGRDRYLCRCACGTEKKVRGSSLTGGDTTSCGCFAREASRARRTDLATRFWSRVNRRGPDECWPFLGKVNAGGGHGMFHECVRQPNGTYRQLLAHRVAYQLHHGADPGERCVCHRCDNPPCCNPAHLFLGTNKDNVHDARAKGRMCVGEANGHATLTAAQVAEIRAALASAPRSSGGARLAWGVLDELAKRYGVSRHAISDIHNGRSWSPMTAAAKEP